MTNMFSVHHVKAGEQFDFRKLNVVGETRPIRVYIKPDGAQGDKPSFCFVDEMPLTKDLVGMQMVTISQISADMFRPFYEELKKIYGDA